MDKKINICQGCDSFFPIIDGVAYVIKNTYQYFDAQGCDVSLVIPNLGNDTEVKKKFYPNINNICRIPCINNFWWSGYPMALSFVSRKWVRFLDVNKPDIIHIHSPFQIGKLLLKYAKKHNIPTLLTFHTKFQDDVNRIVKFTPFRKIMYKRINYVCNNVDIIYTVSDGMIDVIKSYGITTPVKVIKNATEMVPFDKPKEIIDEINKKYKINEDTFVFVFCARMVKIKNLQMIIDTFKVLNKKYQDYKFFICGDGPDLEWLKKSITKLNLADKFIFTGMINDRNLLAKIFQRADLNFFPSMYDTTSLTKYEAACFETPILMIKDTTPAYDIIDNENGFLGENNGEKLAKKVLEIINDKKLLKNVGKKAFKTLYVTWNDVLELYGKAYEETIASKH